MEILYIILTNVLFIVLYLLYNNWITKPDSKSKKDVDKNKKRKSYKTIQNCSDFVKRNPIIKAGDKNDSC